MTGHQGSDGSDTSDRLERYGRWSGGIAENISYGKDYGINVVMQLLVDDGVPSRAHRRNLFDEDFTVTGIFSGPHKTMLKMTCINYADKYEVGLPPLGLQEQMDEFLQEEVVFRNMPANCIGYSQSLKVQVVGRKATKTVTRTCRLTDGSEIALTATDTRKFAKIVMESAEQIKIRNEALFDRKYNI